MKIVRKIWNFITTLLVVAIAALAIALVGVRLISLELYIVLSGSMEPTYPTGSVLYVKETDPYTLEQGDVITFRLVEDTIATHRIVEVTEDESGSLAFRTKGDANEVEDASLVPAANVVGSPVFHIPQLGYLVAFIQEPPGTYLAIVVAAVVLLMLFVPDLLFEDKEEAAKKEAKKAKKKAKKAKKKAKKAKKVKSAATAAEEE